MSSASIEIIESPLWEDMFDIPRADRSVADRKQFEVLETSSKSKVAGLPVYNFEITNVNNFYDLHNSAWRILFQILKQADGTPFANDARIDLGSSAFLLFEKMTLFLNDVEVEVVQRAQLRGLLLELLMQKDSDKGSQAQSWFYPETSSDYRGQARLPTPGIVTLTGDPPAAPVSDVIMPTPGNTSFTARANRHKIGGVINPSNKVELWLPLAKCFGYIRDNASAVICQRIRIEVTPAREGLGLIKATNVADNGKAVIDYMSLWTWAVTPSKQFEPEILRNLNSGKKIVRMWAQHDVRECGTIDDVANQHQMKVINKVATLGRVYVFAQAVPVGNGNQLYNPGMFAPINWTSARLTLNEKVFPAIEYKLDFPNNQYQRAYDAFLAATRDAEGDCESYVDFDTFKESYRMLVFDLNAPGQAVYDMTSQSDLMLDFVMADSPVTDAYGTGAGGLNKQYRVFAVTETYRTITVDLKDGYMSFSNPSA